MENCKKSFLKRLKGQQKELEKFELKPYTGSSHKSSVADQHKSAITAIADQVALTYHNIQWDVAKVTDSESDKTTRWVTEAIWIRRKGKNNLNTDKGAYKLSNIFDQFNLTTPSSAASSSYKRTMLSGKGCQSEVATSLAEKHN